MLHEFRFAALSMAVHTLHTKQIFQATRQEAWDFFLDPRNLLRITPPELGFEILTKDLPTRMREGMVITYRVRPLLGLPMTWLTEIMLVEEVGAVHRRAANGAVCGVAS